MILVLEDMDVRVQWLTRMFPDVNVSWHDNVTAQKVISGGYSETEFMASLEALEAPPSLVILDHDLGSIQTPWVPEGEDGLSGSDAADRIQVTCPILIWSVNPDGAANMARTLANSGHTWVDRIPFLERNYVHLAGYIATALLEGNRRS